MVRKSFCCIIILLFIVVPAYAACEIGGCGAPGYVPHPEYDRQQADVNRARDVLMLADCKGRSRRWSCLSWLLSWQ
jgi:hypothetical protein